MFYGSIDFCPDVWTLTHKLSHFVPVYWLNIWLKTCPNVDLYPFFVINLSKSLWIIVWIIFY